MKRILLALYVAISVILLCSEFKGSGTPECVLLYYMATGVNLVYAGNKFLKSIN